MADKEKYFIPVEGKLIEVEENVYIAYYKMGRRERYLEERDKDNGVLSYDALDQNGVIGQEMFEDPTIHSLEDMALAKELIEQLHRCIDMLPKAERELMGKTKGHTGRKSICEFQSALRILPAGRWFSRN